MPGPPSEEDHYTVVEGNRRLASLKILADPDLVGGISGHKEWLQLANDSKVPLTLPVYLARDREEVAPIIGYRHISGIQPWEPFAKARFIAGFVDQGQDLEDVAEKVGDSRTNVASHYRNYNIVETARRDFGIDTSRAVEDFGVFTRAMGQTKIRDHIGAPAPAQVRPGKPPIEKSREDDTKELMSWLFGDDEHPAVIRESRDLSRLADVLAEEEGVKALRATRSLEDARLAVNGPKQRIISLLSSANSNLMKAREGILDFRDDPEINGLLLGLQGNLNTLIGNAAND